MVSAMNHDSLRMLSTASYLDRKMFDRAVQFFAQNQLDTTRHLIKTRSRRYSIGLVRAGSGASGRQVIVDLTSRGLKEAPDHSATSLIFQGAQPCVCAPMKELLAITSCNAR
jgi:hypothetical protein